MHGKPQIDGDEERNHHCPKDEVIRFSEHMNSPIVLLVKIVNDSVTDGAQQAARYRDRTDHAYSRRDSHLKKIRGDNTTHDEYQAGTANKSQRVADENQQSVKKSPCGLHCEFEAPATRSDKNSLLGESTI